MSNSKLDKLKSGIKHGTEVTLNLSSNATGNTNDEHKFPRKLLLTNTQVWRLCKTFLNNSSANIKFSNIHLQIIGQWWKFLGRPLGLLLKIFLPGFPFATS